MTDEPAKKTDDRIPQEDGDNNVMGGIILIAAGLVLLSNTMGFVGWEIWNVLFRFWPVLLILGGIEMLLGKNLAGRIFSGIVSLAAVSFVIAYAWAAVNPSFDAWMRSRMPLWPRSYRQQRMFTPFRNSF
jgi:lia operon protein LiaF